jgi:hypothetical protein
MKSWPEWIDGLTVGKAITINDDVCIVPVSFDFGNESVDVKNRK